VLFRSILWAAAGFAQRPGFLSARAPALRLAAIWGLAQLGGGLGYGLLHAGPQPMIGASGVAFGLVAALQTDLCAGDRAAGDARGAWRRAAGSVLLLGLVNVLSWALLDGRLAWETHLGGALGGLLGWALLAPPAQPSARG
jgi:membrane associated rhomboid family serine protease